MFPSFQSAQFRVVGALALCLLTAGFVTETRADGLSYDLVRVVSGKGYPAVILKPQVAIKRVTIHLTRGDGKTLTLRAKGLRAGRHKKLTIKQANGRFHYQAKFEIDWADTRKPTTSFETEFSLTKIGKLKVFITAADVNLDARTVRCRSNNPILKTELVLHGAAGVVLDRFEVEQREVEPGGHLNLSWEVVKQEVLFMDLKVTDVAGFWTVIRITPFSIAIPHEEVEFASGQHAIRSAEAPKIKDTMRLIREALAKHGTLLTLRLYVAGYTDTVGSRGSNQELSTRRARAIAGWFRKHGLKIPIYYQGFGEDVLARKTPNETAEALNRRALYLLSSQSPGKTKQTPRENWHRL
jgi:outer membrane protein OmpA-like peptidoglycan-associated protein